VETATRDNAQQCTAQQRAGYVWPALESGCAWHQRVQHSLSMSTRLDLTRRFDFLSATLSAVGDDELCVSASITLALLFVMQQQRDQRSRRIDGNTLVASIAESAKHWSDVFPSVRLSRFPTVSAVFRTCAPSDSSRAASAVNAASLRFVPTVRESTYLW